MLGVRYRRLAQVAHEADVRVAEGGDGGVGGLFRLERKPLATIYQRTPWHNFHKTDNRDTAKYCNVLGYWISSDSIECAHRGEGRGAFLG